MINPFRLVPETRRERWLVKAGLFIAYPLVMTAVLAVMVIAVLVLVVIWPLIPFCKVEQGDDGVRLRLPWQQEATDEPS